MRQLGHPPPLGKTIVAAGPHGLEANTVSMNGVIVAYLSGAILFREESACLRMFVKDLLSRSRHIVLDLGEVTHIDSGGLGTLVSLFISARSFGGSIKLANLGSHPIEVLYITKLATVFEVFDKTEDAVASFKRATAS
jgi:anti-anti-sigma factor